MSNLTEMRPAGATPISVDRRTDTDRRI